MYVYVCMCVLFVCVCVCTYACLHIYALSIYIHIYICVRVYVCVYIPLLRRPPTEANSKMGHSLRAPSVKNGCVQWLHRQSHASSSATSSSSFSYYYSHYMIASSVRIQYLHFTLELRTVAPSQANFTTRESRDSGEHLHFTLEMVDAGSGLRIVLNRTLQPPEALKLSGLTHYLGDPLVLPPFLPLPPSLSRSRAIATLLATHQQALWFPAGARGWGSGKFSRCVQAHAPCTLVQSDEVREPYVHGCWHSRPSLVPATRARRREHCCESLHCKKTCL
jgi:hypothetical protein